jgi:guanylate kinase
VIQRRLGVARQEIAQWRQFDYLLISTTIDEDLRRMNVILEAERLRQHRAKPPDLESSS